MTDLYEAMSTLRAVRKLRTDPIPDDVLERVLQAACWAPTGGNQQPWRVVVVRDAGKKRVLQDIYRPEWQKYVEGFMARLAGLPPEELTKWQKIAAAGDHLADHLHEAPAILLFCGNPKMMAITDAKLDRISMVGGGSVYPPVQNAMLACVAEGLQFLDDTVGIASLKPARNAHGRLQLQRAYDFEFSDTGDNRVKGSIVMLGRRVLLLNIKPRSAAEVITLH